MIHCASVFVLAAALVLTLTPKAHGDGLQISAAADLTAPVFLDRSASQNKPGLRGAEIMLYGPIDPNFEGRLTAAAHEEDGAFNFEVHEAFFETSTLLAPLRLRAGKFFLSMGRLNGFHQHDWPFISAPKIHRHIVGSPESWNAEGVEDTALEVTWPLPTKTAIEVLVGVANGYYFGHSHSAGNRPVTPTHYLRPTLFFDGDNGGGVLLGATYLARKDYQYTRTDLLGLDGTLKVRGPDYLAWLIQSEFWFQTVTARSARPVEKVGGYVLVDRGLDRNWSAGLRADLFSEISRKFLNGERRPNLDFALVPQLTYRSSEFAKFRLAYTHEVQTQQGVDNGEDRVVELQFVYFLGAHPAHDF